MQIRRGIALSVALVLLCGATSTVFAQNKKGQEKRSKQEQADIEALVKMVDGAMAGQTAPADLAITFRQSHFLKVPDGATFVPFSMTLDRSKLAAPGVAVYVRVVNKGAAAAAAGDKDKKKDDKAPRFPWDDISFGEVKADGTVARALTVKPGEYELLVGVKERTTGEKNQPPTKMGLLRRDLTVPDFNKSELVTSSILCCAIEELTAPLTPEQQREDPYAFGAVRFVPSENPKLAKSGELGLSFWIYGTAIDAATSKPDVVVEYSFNQKTADGEKYFNKAAPQELNAKTLPQFDPKAGLTAFLAIPLGSFPPGEYRAEIKITDKAAGGKSMTQSVTFTVS